ncbi:FAD-dependent oxidoreductase [Nocardia terpenica]|uniref:FAD-dependent monooxygenase n=1 Tax=Nocardia terpenica TaxID=455432 RepID=A0A6G9Z0I4_9NOCA|nr:FAD-dependent monooxygenase [Nocardia terpenica]QIS18974.1 FAD-dependent monooxygenase [Nocardia terpenica]
MTHALIIGGGIAGPVTAMALQKAGISSTVYEAYPTGGDDIGAFLMIMHNGMDALRAIGADEPVVAASFRTDNAEYLDGAGNVFSRGPFGPDDGVGPRTLTRADLYRTLHDELRRRGGRIEHGKRLSSVVTRADGRVAAAFDDGTHAEGDLLIGADGIHSVTRSLIDPEAPTPRYSGLNIAYGYTDAADIPLSPNTFRMIRGGSGFGHTTSPEGITFWVAHLPGAPLDKAEIAATTTTQWRERATELFADDAETTAIRVINSTTDEIMVSAIHEIPSLPHWHRDSMVLVGDAAHAASPLEGQGASMALEDSVILAQCLRDLPDLSDAFGAYECIRRSRVEHLVAFSGRAATMAEAKEKARPERRSWLVDHHIDWDTHITEMSASTSN